MKKSVLGSKLILNIENEAKKHLRDVRRFFDEKR